MACNCIDKVEKLIKEKINESGCLDVGIGVPSGLAMVNIYGMFHKQKKIGVISISPEDLQEGRIYFLRSNVVTSTIKGFICVKCNLWKENKMIGLHFSWQSDGLCPTLKVNDPDADCGSVQSKGFANFIGFNLVSDNFDDVSIYHPSQAQVSMLEAKLREIGYEFTNGKMQKIDGNKS